MPDYSGGEHWAVSPLDGRYKNKLAHLGARVSEGALIVQRIKVELTWLWFLAGKVRAGELHLPWKPAETEVSLLSECLKEDFREHVSRVKEIEALTNHDVKAVEYFLREHLRSRGLGEAGLCMIHFPCTSEDINNLSYGLMLKEVRDLDVLPSCRSVLRNLAQKAGEYQNLGMISRTHGQEATPTTMGKEIAVFAHRLRRICCQLSDFQFDGKINGAVGNYNAQMVVCPDADWEGIAREFVEDILGLRFNPYTTQIENHDGIARWCQLLSAWQTVSLDLCQDMWLYISFGYFRQKLLAHETGSSTMPHKVNPIDFENAEGNFGISVALADHFSRKLPVSRMQRDLSDSTTLRALGSMTGHFILAQDSLLRGLGKVVPDARKMNNDLQNCHELLAEPVQMVLRAFGVRDAYERLKELTRGRKVTKEQIHSLVKECPELAPEARSRLLALSPEAYTGLASRLASRLSGELLTELDQAEIREKSPF